jgi:L-asparaginase
MKNIVILATGGTIAGAGEQGKDIGYKSGSIEAQTLIDAVPELKHVANIFVEQVCNINSDDITSEIWITLAERIKELAVEGFGTSHECVDGFVIMHGTDTMEETAFFLSLTLGANERSAAKPVVLTGSMRPATAAKPDGPANLLFSVKSAVDLSERVEATAKNMPVYVAFAGKLMDARSVQKIHANDLDAFAEVGTARILGPTFDITSLLSLPKVSVLYFNADADASLIRFAAERSAGLVIAGAGAGEFSQSWAAAITEVVAKKIPVVISTRINRGCIVPEQLLVKGTIAAYDLPPAKAAVLLRLALTLTRDPVEIQKIFNE